MVNSIGWRFEQYTIKRPQEVLLVTAEVAGEPDQVAIFRGFSSSLVRSTHSDPDVPVLPDDALIVAVDRLHAPYNPASPHYIQQGLSLEAAQQLLAEVNC
jgi:hypothetical protein